MAYDPSTPLGQVRLLINDTSSDPVFGDPDLSGFLAMEGGNVKLAAAQALDVIADDEALTLKIVSTDTGSTNGPGVAASLRQRAESLRKQVVYDIANSTDDEASVFEVIPIVPECSTRPLWWSV